MTWVLIIVMWGYGGSSSNSVFANEGLCRHAKVDITHSVGRSDMFVECYPTGVIVK
jgi:hypothetical protein